MFLAAKTFSVHRRVHNHFTKRILDLILNRKNLLRRENGALGRLSCEFFGGGGHVLGCSGCAAKMATFPVNGSVRFLPRAKVSESTERRRAQGLRRKTRLMEGRVKATRVRSMRRGTASTVALTVTAHWKAAHTSTEHQQECEASRTLEGKPPHTTHAS